MFLCLCFFSAHSRLVFDSGLIFNMVIQLSQGREPGARLFVEQNLVDIMRLQEKEFKIKYSGVPNVEYRLSEDSSSSILSSYKPGTKTIYLNIPFFAEVSLFSDLSLKWNTVN